MGVNNSAGWNNNVEAIVDGNQSAVLAVPERIVKAWADNGPRAHHPRNLGRPPRRGVADRLVSKHA
jgi:hypothetical protein